MHKVLIALAAVVAVGLPAGEVGATRPADVEIVVPTDLSPGVPAPFTASGAAVDLGTVCPTGTVTDAAGKVVGFSPNGFNFQGIKHFTCDDGSGEFFVNLQARIDFVRGDSFHWNVLGGTGAYADLHGAGSGFGIPGIPCGDPEACILDVYQGGFHAD